MWKSDMISFSTVTNRYKKYLKEIPKWRNFRFTKNIITEFWTIPASDNIAFFQDAKKMKKAVKEAQRKLAETLASKAAKARSWSFKSTRAVGSTSVSPLQSSFAFPSGNYTSRFSPSVGGTRNISPFVGGTPQKRGTCFSCGKPGHWRNECPLLVVA